MTLKLTEFDISKYLETGADVAEYLTNALEKNNFEYFKYALSQVAKLKGMTELANKTGLPRITLYKMFEEDRNPEFKSVKSVIDALGLKISITNKSL